ncbi:MAG: hypothetical protein LBJ74_05080 [Heliobacteriaceae bacterium]|jgi:hypothetical protein|nr:hypothetical protein [Heliobacteriaceae bacterium]
MISKVGSINFGSSNLIQQIKNNQQPGAAPQENVSLQGSEALASYNAPLVQQDNLMDRINSIKPSEPVVLPEDFFAKLEGEKVLKSDGTLAAIVVKGDKTSKEYLPDRGTYRFIERDNATGMLVKQANISKRQDGQYEEYWIDEFSNGKQIKHTTFENGKPELIAEYPSERTRMVCFHDAGKLSSYIEVNESTGLNEEYKFISGELYLKEVKDDAGRLIKSTNYTYGKSNLTEEFKYQPIQNTTGIDPKTIDLKPAEKVVYTDANFNQPGEKTFYSNGALETLTIRNGDKTTKLYFDITGKKCERAEESVNGNIIREIKMHEDGKISVRIREYNEAGKELKQTYFWPDGALSSVSNYNPETEYAVKSADYSKDGWLKQYYECDGNAEADLLLMNFDKDGNLTRLQKKED